MSEQEEILTEKDKKDREFREKIYSQVSEICEEHGLTTTCFLSIHPDNKEPIIFFRGSKITAARLTALFTRLVKTEINRELAT